VEFRDFGTSEVRGLRGVNFKHRSCEGARAESPCECVAHLSGGHRKGDRWHVLIHRGGQPIVVLSHLGILQKEEHEGYTLQLVRL
jgi:hypothetical protein